MENDNACSQTKKHNLYMQADSQKKDEKRRRK